MAFYAGFDVENYPGIDMMNWFRANTNLKWCGYYLAPAPNRSPSGWNGQYESLKNDWGVVPIYVGQQDPSTGSGAYRPSSILTANQGTFDGKNAAYLASADKFPNGTAIFLDWEKGDLEAGGATAYIAAWLQAVSFDALFVPGLYCSYVIAQQLDRLVNSLNPRPTVLFWCWRVNIASEHRLAGELSALPELDPANCGFVGAEAWQCDQNAIVSLPDGAPLNSIQVDFSTSTHPNPGTPP